MGKTLGNLAAESMKHFDPMSWLEKVFGKFRGNTVEPSKTRRHCARCKRKYSLLNMRTKKDDPNFDKQRFCSALCADQSPATPFKLSRQAHRAMLRRKAAEEVALEMGRGPKAAEPRRARRRVALKRATKMYRDQKAGV